jgi:hypothetical protein
VVGRVVEKLAHRNEGHGDPPVTLTQGGDHERGTAGYEEF